MQNPVIRRIQFGAKNILCDSKDNIQLKTNKYNSNGNANGRTGIENNKKEVSLVTKAIKCYELDGIIGNNVFWYVGTPF